MALTTYGIRLRIRPDTSGNKPRKAYTVLYRADSAVAAKTEIVRSWGTAEWTYDDTMPLSAGHKFYWLRTEYPGMISSSYTGYVDCYPTDLGVEV